VRYAYSCLTKDKFQALSGAAYCMKRYVAPTELDRLVNCMLYTFRAYRAYVWLLCPGLEAVAPRFRLAHIRRVSPIWRDEFAFGS
jgi:hypothetical protein